MHLRKNHRPASGYLSAIGIGPGQVASLGPGRPVDAAATRVKT
jgi:hypothetical protein